MSPLRVLLVADLSAPRCGIRNFADQLATALCRQSGLDVGIWDGAYERVYARREAGQPAYLPEWAASADVILVNWHPIAFNHYTPDHFPDGPLLSAYLHDVPPWSSCPFQDRIDVCVTAEPFGDSLELPYPIPDWVRIEDVERTPQFSVGTTGIRGDGVALIRAVCEDRGWDFRPSGETWLPLEAEIRRLAASTVNVLWYEEKRGKSGATSMALASGRPLILSDSPMFSHLDGWGFLDGVFRPYRDIRTLPQLLDVAHDLWRLGHLESFSTRRIREIRRWDAAAAALIGVWRQRLAERRA